MRFIQYTRPLARSASPAALFGGRLGQAGIGTELDWLFGTDSTGFPGAGRGGQFPVDLYSDKDNTYVRAELPGANRDAISVEIVDGSLSIQASRKEKTGEGESTVSFSRQVAIPEEVQTDKVSAAYVDGVLTVTLPRREEAKPRKINVSVN
jgi:HSP20 family protein